MLDRATLNQKKLDLVLAIDYIRDTAAEPQIMFGAIVNLLAEHLCADASLLYVIEAETGQIQLKALSEKKETVSALEPTVLRLLARHTCRSAAITTWDAQSLRIKLDISSPPPSLQLAAIPVSLASKPLGVLILARDQAPYDRDDVELLEMAETQLDSAVIQAHTYHTLQQRNKELETIYRIDRIRDLNIPFEEMLQSALHEISRVIHAETCFVMLYDRAGRQLKLQTATSSDLSKLSPYQDTIHRIAHEAIGRGELVCYNNLGDVLRSILCTPLILNGEIIGVFGLVNRYEPLGFSGDDRRLLAAIASQMDTAIFENLERRRLRKVLGRSLESRVLERVLASPDVDLLKAERAILTVLFSDVRGSTRLAEITDPELLVGFMNDYLSRMTEVILSYEGTLDKFVGDAVMALFGAPIPHEDHPLCAVRVGLAMQEAHQKVIESWQSRGVEPTPIGIGIATGELIIGEMGCPQRTDYTVIGRAANLGSRICGVAGPGQVLVSEATYQLVKQKVEAKPITGLQLKGLGQEVTAYHVTRILG